MHPKARFLLTVAMDIDPDKEALFNEVYDTEHVPLLMKVPGVLSVMRSTREPLRLAIAGGIKTVTAEGEPKYSAIYELESPDVLTSEAWARAVDQGRWPTEIRPHLSNHRHVLRRILRED